jgi:hypothetical protein
MYEMGWPCSTYGGGGGRFTYRVWWRDLKRQFGKLRRNEWKTFYRILKEPFERAWAKLIWLRIVTSGEPF